MRLSRRRRCMRSHGQGPIRWPFISRRAMTARTNTEPLTPSALDAAPAQPPGRPTLFIVVDTEEEFDWRAPLSREQTSVRAMRNIHLLQRLLTAERVKPTYVIDYPVATQRDG